MMFAARRLLTLAVLFYSASSVASQPLEFQLTFYAKVKATTFTRRGDVLLSNARRTEPPGSPNWFRPEPAFALDVRDWKPGELLTVGKTALAYPTPLDKLENKTYWAMAVMDLDQGDRSFGAAPGNI